MLRYLQNSFKLYSEKLLYSLGIWNREANLLVIGLDNSGKTTLLYKLTKTIFSTLRLPSFSNVQRHSQIGPSVLFNYRNKFERGKTV